jgi:hypothetical protein
MIVSMGAVRPPAGTEADAAVAGIRGQGRQGANASDPPGDPSTGRRREIAIMLFWMALRQGVSGADLAVAQ